VKDDLMKSGVMKSGVMKSGVMKSGVMKTDPMKAAQMTTDPGKSDLWKSRRTKGVTVEGGLATRSLSDPKTLVTIVGQLLLVRTVLNRFKEARAEGDAFDLFDAAVNAVALVTGTIVLVRRLRRGEEA
jgi:hypothetical protein